MTKNNKAAAMLAEVADKYIVKAEAEDKKPEYPELWFMFEKHG